MTSNLFGQILVRIKVTFVDQDETFDACRTAGHDHLIHKTEFCFGLRGNDHAHKINVCGQRECVPRGCCPLKRRLTFFAFEFFNNFKDSVAQQETGFATQANQFLGAFIPPDPNGNAVVCDQQA